MPVKSFDIAPADLDLPDELVDKYAAVRLVLFGEMDIAGGGENGLMPGNSFHFEQVNPLRLDAWHNCGTGCVA